VAAGSPFNVGEMTVTRAAVRLESGETGVSYVAGRSREHAEVAAAVDAMMQSEALRPLVQTDIVDLLKRLTKRDANWPHARPQPPASTSSPWCVIGDRHDDYGH